MSRARDRIWDSHARKCDGDNRKISFHIFRNENSDKRRNDICVAKCKRKYVKPGYEKKKIGTGERRSDMRIAF